LNLITVVASVGRFHVNILLFLPDFKQSYLSIKFGNNPNIHFNANTFRVSRPVPCWQTDTKRNGQVQQSSDALRL